MSLNLDSPEALFAAAQDLARRRGVLGRRMASLMHSRTSRAGYVLKDGRGSIIARLSMQEVRAIAQRRQRLLNSSPARSELAQIGSIRRIDQKMALRSQPDRVRAMAWAISTGRRVPSGAFRRRDLLIGGPLLLLGLVPGIVYLVRARWRHLRYQVDRDALVQRWRALHKPDPSEEWFASFKS